MPGATPALALERVSKSYGRTEAVRALSLVLEAGELLTVIGPSGCGKSTLLRLVAGLERPDAGAIRVGDDAVADDRTWRPPERRRVGMVFQDHALFPHLNVARNVGFGLDQLSRQDRASRVGEALELAGLAGLARRHPHELSGGEQQRVALARALAPRPAVVLLDEPFSSLDENLRAKIRADTLAVLRETSSAAVLVTHDQTEALSLGDRLAVMREGILEQVGTPQAVYEAPATRFVATFMGDADFLPVHAREGMLTSEIGVVSTASGWEGVDGEAQVMLRPHDVTMVVDQQSDSRVEHVEYHGPFVLHVVRLGSGRTVRSWQYHGVRHPVGTPVAVTAVPKHRPVLMTGDSTSHAAPAPGAPVDSAADRAVGG